MSEGDDSGEKEHEPTQRKLDEARRKGELPRSTDLTTAAAYAGLLLVGLAAGGTTLARMGDTGLVLLAQSDRLAPLMLSQSRPPAGGLMATLGLSLAPWFGLPALAALAMLLALRGLVFAPQKLAPKLSRVSPVANARNKFGRSGLFEFAKSAAKLVILAALLWVFLLSNLPRLIGTMTLAPAMVGVAFLRLLLEFLALVVAIMAAIGVLDFLWQRHDHLRRQRMTHKELRDEVRQSEGDPHMKGQRRQRGQEIATNRMMAAVPKADVVVVNPTHYAVALAWDRTSGRAPVCVAKGVDATAARIRESAATAGVPIRRDPATARALHATLEIGQEVRPEHYRPVAAAIRFAEAMRRRARRGGVR